MNRPRVYAIRMTLFVVSLCAIAEGACQIREWPAFSASIYGNYREVRRAAVSRSGILHLENAGGS